MEVSRNNNLELVSVIIPSFNHGRYIRAAIESILSQAYANVEIIVIDDGSTDDTGSIVKELQGVKYFYQKNAGLSAARNFGIAKSSGNYLVFLDADDWLLPDALAINYCLLQNHNTAGFVSGSHYKLNSVGQIVYHDNIEIDGNHYQHLLRGNYIGMHAAVMYRREVFDDIKFDTSLKACEDYDVYFKVSRKFQVIHHNQPIAVYYFHDSNMSGNIPNMLKNALLVLQRQEHSLKAEDEPHWKEGIKNWKNYYSNLVYNALNKQSIRQLFSNLKDLNFLIKNQPALAMKAVTNRFKKTVKKSLGFFWGSADRLPGIGSVNLGDLNRTTPFSQRFGYDRGGPLDRYYIENFLDQNKMFIKGRILEIGDNEYTLRFGQGRITKSEILHVDTTNKNATIIGDLTDDKIFTENSFDCIILTQTLQLIYNPQKAVQNCYFALKPGGVLLLTVPGITHIDGGEWKDHWLWAFTQLSVNRILAEIFPKHNIKTQAFGNVLVAAAFLYCMGIPELSKKQMDTHDPQYQLIITGLATKPS